MADLALSTVVVAVLVLSALWIYFRSWGAIAAILGALTVGCATTFGLTYFIIGHLNANTAFLGSIVAGNGINVAKEFSKEPPNTMKSKTWIGACTPRLARN